MDYARVENLFRLWTLTTKIDNQRVLSQLGRPFHQRIIVAREQQDFRVLDQFVRAADQATGQMRDALFDVIPIRTGDE